MDSLLLLGAGGYGRTVKELAEALGIFAEIDVLDDTANTALGPCCAYAQPALRARYAFAYPAFGDNALRLAWCQKLVAAGYRLPVLVHPQAWVSASAQVAEGAAVLACAAVGCGTVVARGALVNIGALVDHDCIIGEGVHLAPGAVVKAGNKVEALEKLESGTVLLRAT